MASKPSTTPGAKGPRRRRNADAPASAARPLRPPPGGAAVRMYRIGHGDCFLVAFDGDDPDRPAYVLIDCGYKPGSPCKLDAPTTVREIGRDIIAATGGFVDVAVVTHEHQDHVNGLTATNFPGLTVGKVWFAWTENPEDDVADQLRRKFKDRLLGLIDARAHFQGLGMNAATCRLDWSLELEFGEPATRFNGVRHLAAAGKDPSRSANKLAMAFLRGCAAGDPDYLYPHERIRAVPRARSARAFVLGPPRDMRKIDDLDPVGDETFGDEPGHGFGVGTAAPAGAGAGSPFPRRHVLRLDEVFADAKCGAFFKAHYGAGPGDAQAADGKAVPDDAPWRRLTRDDAAEADALALAMNNATNNSSLVLAFELSKGGKVLLFVGDAQAGNWRSWSEADFDDVGERITARDLLGRTVLYKVGHHGSHNATLNGKPESETACLAWMGQGPYAGEFTALITAVEKWARQKPNPDWNHPLPAIKDALLDKAGGRVLQTDSPMPVKPAGRGGAGWSDFVGRVSETPLYFDLRVDP